MRQPHAHFRGISRVIAIWHDGCSTHAQTHYECNVKVGAFTEMKTKNFQARIWIIALAVGTMLSANAFAEQNPKELVVRYKNNRSLVTKITPRFSIRAKAS